MTKYNKSEIMKNAWEISRRWTARGLTFGQCLEKAWAEAKKAAQNAAAYAITKFEDGMEITVDGYTRVLNRWTKYGNDRIYVNGGSRKGEGYIDLKNGNCTLNKTSYNAKIKEIVLAMEF